MKRALALVPALLMAACATAPTADPSAAGSGQPSAAATAAPSGAAATTAAAPTTQTSLDRTAGWRDDLARIIPGLERIHPNPYHGTTQDQLEAAIGTVSDHVPTSTDDELMVGVLRIGAMLSANGHDGHSGVFVWGTGTYPVESLPLRLWFFGDELVVVDALPPYEDLIGRSVVTIEDRPLAEVRGALDPLIPRDNDQTVRLLSPRYLLIPQVLRGLGLADDGPIALGLTAADGTSSTIDIEPIPMSEYNAWAGPYGLHLPSDPDVLYLSRMDEDLWFERLDDGETLFVQYNHVAHLGPAAQAELAAALRAEDVSRVVLDVRHNTGGEVPALDPMVDLLDDPAVDVPGRLFVIVGRNTWSAGSMLLARLEARTSAVFVGELSAGNPTFYGDVVPLPLPYSGLELTITEMLEVGVDPNDPRLEIPIDAEAVLEVDEWLEGRDPALELILEAGV